MDRTRSTGWRWRWYDQGEGPLALVILPGAVGGADLFFVLFEELRPHVRVIGLDLPFVADAGDGDRADASRCSPDAASRRRSSWVRRSPDSSCRHMRAGIRPGRGR